MLDLSLVQPSACPARCLPGAARVACAPARHLRCPPPVFSPSHCLPVCRLQAAEQLGLPRITSIQNSYSLLVRGSFETDLAEVCAARQANVGLLAYSPLAGGALTGKYIEGGPDTGKARLNLFQGEPQRAKGRRTGRREVVLAAAAVTRVGRDRA